MVKQELSDAYERLKTKRTLYIRATRLGNILGWFGSLLFFFGLFIIPIAILRALVLEQLLYLPIGGFIVVFGVILMYIGFKVNKRMLPPPKLSVGEQEFLKVFEALTNLDTYFSDKIEFSKIEAARKISKFERDIDYPEDCSETLLFELTKDRNELLFLFKQNLKERLLPAINRGKEEEIRETYHIIEKIAEYLLNPIASALEDLNDFMSELPPYKKEKVSLILFFERYLKSRHAIFEFLIVLVSFVAYYIGVKFLNISTGEAYIAAMALLGTLTAGYMAIIAMKR